MNAGISAANFRCGGSILFVLISIFMTAPSHALEMQAINPKFTRMLTMVPADPNAWIKADPATRKNKLFQPKNSLDIARLGLLEAMGYNPRLFFTLSESKRNRTLELADQMIREDLRTHVNLAGRQLNGQTHLVLATLSRKLEAFGSLLTPGEQESAMEVIVKGVPKTEVEDPNDEAAVQRMLRVRREALEKAWAAAQALGRQ